MPEQHTGGLALAPARSTSRPCRFEVQRGLLASLSRPAARPRLARPARADRDADTLDEWRAGAGRAWTCCSWQRGRPGAAAAKDDPLPDAAAARGRPAALRRLQARRAGGLLYDAAADRCIAWAPRAAATSWIPPAPAMPSRPASSPAGCEGEAAGAALDRGVVAASFAIEDWGAAGLLRATPGALEARLRAWFRGMNAVLRRLRRGRAAVTGRSAARRGGARDDARHARPAALRTGSRVAAELEDEVRDGGAVPATIGVLDGHAPRRALGRASWSVSPAPQAAAKLNLEQPRGAVAAGGAGSTTVAATLLAAHARRHRRVRDRRHRRRAPRRGSAPATSRPT